LELVNNALYREERDCKRISLSFKPIWSSNKCRNLLLSVAHRTFPTDSPCDSIQCTTVTDAQEQFEQIHLSLPGISIVAPE
jgi:hypothetical protein